MSVISDIREIQSALRTAEANPSRRSAHAVHNLLAAKMVEHKDRLGLTDDDIAAFGGGVPKPDED